MWVSAPKHLRDHQLMLATGYISIRLVSDCGPCASVSANLIIANNLCYLLMESILDDLIKKNRSFQLGLKMDKYSKLFKQFKSNIWE